MNKTETASVLSAMEREAADFLAGDDPHSDIPAWVCPTIAGFARALNRGLFREHLDELAPCARLLVGAMRGSDSEAKRAFISANWGLSVAALAMEAAGNDAEAADLRAVPEITDRASAKAAAYASRGSVPCAAAAAATIAAADASRGFYAASSMASADAGCNAARAFPAFAPALRASALGLIARLCA